MSKSIFLGVCDSKDFRPKITIPKHTFVSNSCSFYGFIVIDNLRYNTKIVSVVRYNSKGGSCGVYDLGEKENHKIPKKFLAMLKLSDYDIPTLTEEKEDEEINCLTNFGVVTTYSKCRDDDLFWGMELSL